MAKCSAGVCVPRLLRYSSRHHVSWRFPHSRIEFRLDWISSLQVIDGHANAEVTITIGLCGKKKKKNIGSCNRCERLTPIRKLPHHTEQPFLIIIVLHRMELTSLCLLLILVLFFITLLICLAGWWTASNQKSERIAGQQQDIIDAEHHYHHYFATGSTHRPAYGRRACCERALYKTIYTDDALRNRRT